MHLIIFSKFFSGQKYIVKVFKLVKYLHDRLVAAQENLQLIKDSIRSWGKVPLFQRKELNPVLMLYTEPRDVILMERVDKASTTQRLIDLLMYVNLKLFFDIPRRYTLPSGEGAEEEDDPDDIWPPVLSLSAISKVAKTKKKNDKLKSEKLEEKEEDERSGSEEEIITPFHRYELLKGISEDERKLFHDYEMYVDTNVAQCLLDSVITSVTYLRLEVENRFENSAPIFEIFMELQEPIVVYFLNLDPNSKTGFVFFVETLLDDIYDTMILLYRVAQDPPEITNGEVLRFMGKLTINLLTLLY